MKKFICKKTTKKMISIALAVSVIVGSAQTTDGLWNCAISTVHAASDSKVSSGFTPDVHTSLFLDFQEEVLKSSTVKSTEHGVLSSANSSFGLSSTGHSGNGVKISKPEGTNKIEYHIGFQGASETDTLQFMILVKENSSISEIIRVSVNGREIHGTTAITKGDWVTVQTGEIGATSGYITIEGYSETKDKCYLYMDNVRIIGPVTADDGSDSIFLDFTDGFNKSYTAKDTTHGTFSPGYTGSTKHISFRQSSTAYSGKSLKCNVENGLNKIEFYMGFQNARKTDRLTFKMYVPNHCTISQIDNISVNDIKIMGEKKITKGEWITVDAGEIGATSGYITFSYYSPVTTSDQYLYIDNLCLGKGDMTSGSTASSKILNIDFNDGFLKSSTAKSTEHGVLSSKNSSMYQSENGYIGNGVKISKPEGTKEFEIHVGFNNAQPTDKLSYAIFVKEDSSVYAITSVSVNGKEISGYSDITKGIWSFNNVGEIGATDGYITIKGIASSDEKCYFYMDDICINRY